MTRASGFATFKKRVADELRDMKLVFTSNPHLSQARAMDFLFYEGRDGRKVRPLGVLLGPAVRDDDAIAAFASTPTLETGQGEYRRLYLAGTQEAGASRTAQAIAVYLSSEHDGPSFCGAEWNGDSWTTFDIATYAAALPRFDDLDVSYRHASSDDDGDPRRHRSPRPVRMKTRRHRLPFVPTATDGSVGIRYERELGIAAAGLGLQVVTSDQLDRVEKIDLLIGPKDGEAPLRSIALQVTFRWNDLLKLEDFQETQPVRGLDGGAAKRLYLQVADGVTTDVAAAAVRAFMLDATGGGEDKAYAEIDADGFRTFAIGTRLRELRMSAAPDNPNLTVGRIETADTQGAMTIRSYDDMAYRALLGSVVDRELEDLIRCSQRGGQSVVGKWVRFVPTTVVIGGARRRRAILVRLS